ncbi:MAG: hypothetical protein M3Y41_21895 [Pseudomonadota bacterium]|nr:hypothetical protein [Pseudomonadota bacterium]
MSVRLGRRAMRAALVWFAAAASFAPASAQAQNDLREFRVGMGLSDLPRTGYTDFACADQPDHQLAGWAAFAACPKDALGLHALSFRYDDAANPLAHVSDKYQGTRVAGHPVLVALLMSDDGQLGGLRIVTDPHAPLYLHKKAFLFAGQVRSRYGSDGWQCTDIKPTSDQEPVGELFINRRCEKETAGRHLILNQQLYRRTGQDLRHFTGGAELTILAAHHE